MSEQLFLMADSIWMRTKDGDDTVRSIFDRHYSRQRYRDGRSPRLFVGPGFKIVLITPDARAIFIWRKFKDACIDERTSQPQAGVNCAVFRNEGPQKSSMLILAAEKFATDRWPGERLYTYVDARKVRPKRDPGRCFRRCGWEPCGHTKSGLLILEKWPDRDPEPDWPDELPELDWPRDARDPDFFNDLKREES